MTDARWHIRERRRLHRLLRHAAREDERLYGSSQMREAATANHH